MGMVAQGREGEDAVAVPQGGDAIDRAWQVWKPPLPLNAM
jgi:hypothetical protein